jgi:hypothetical protein
MTASALLAPLYLYRLSDPLQSGTDMIMRYFSTIRENVRPTIFNSGNGSRMGRYILFRHAVLGDSWSELEPWGIWGFGFRSVCYLVVPHELRVAADPVFLEIDLGVPRSLGFTTLKLSLELNGRRADLILDARITVVVELTAPEKLSGSAGSSSLIPWSRMPRPLSTGFYRSGSARRARPPSSRAQPER